MAHTREEYLDVCKVCTKRSFDMKKGLICSLTKEHANYNESDCPDFDYDSVAADKKAVSDALRKADEENSATFGLAQFGIKNQIVAGLIISGLSLTWLIIGLSYGWIFYYPIIILIIGIVVMIRGFIVEGKKLKAKKEEPSNDILDDKLI
jgi:hypothetical protein